MRASRRSEAMITGPMAANSVHADGIAEAKAGPAGAPEETAPNHGASGP